MAALFRLLDFTVYASLGLSMYSRCASYYLCLYSGYTTNRDDATHVSSDCVLDCMSDVWSASNQGGVDDVRLS